MGEQRGWRNRKHPALSAQIPTVSFCTKTATSHCPFASSFRPSASRFSASCGCCSLPQGASANRPFTSPASPTPYSRSKTTG